MPTRFKYLRPSTKQEACQMKGEYGPAAKCLAGGTDLLLQWRTGATDFGYCIDITHIPDLKYIKRSDRGVRIGALATLANLENAQGTISSMSCMRRTANQMCTPQLRNTATVGGNLCSASPAADLSVLFMALGAEATLIGTSGERTLPVEELFTGVNRTILEDDEILAEVRIPTTEYRTEPSFRRVGRTVVDIALVNAAVSVSVDAGGVITDTRVALGAVAPVPIRARAAEKMLLGAEISRVGKDLIEQVSAEAAAETQPMSDIRASKQYRRYVSRVLVRRSIQESIQRLSGDRS